MTSSSPHTEICSIQWLMYLHANVCTWIKIESIAQSLTTQTGSHFQKMMTVSWHSRCKTHKATLFLILMHLGDAWVAFTLLCTSSWYFLPLKPLHKMVKSFSLSVFLTIQTMLIFLSCPLGLLCFKMISWGLTEVSILRYIAISRAGGGYSSATEISLLPGVVGEALGEFSFCKNPLQEI